jgi:CTP:molybdopterin cytidylyltransferase MocA
MRVAAVLLAAGRGSRFGGESKLLADLGGRPVVDWAAAAIEAAGLAPRAAVVRPGDAAVKAVVAARGFVVVENPRADEGMGTSIAAGAVWARDQGADGVMIALGDAPFVKASHLSGLADPFSRLAPDASAPVVYATVRDDRIGGSDVFSALGNPVIFSAACFGELAALQGDRGARSLFDLKIIVGVTCDPSDLDDIDTPEALAAARRKLAPP